MRACRVYFARSLRSALDRRRLRHDVNRRSAPNPPCSVNHAVARPVRLVGQQPRALGARDGESEHVPPRPGHVGRQQSGLPEHGALIPPYVLVEQPVAADVDDGDHGHGQPGVGGRHVGQQPRHVRRVREGQDELVCAGSARRRSIGKAHCTDRRLCPGRRFARPSPAPCPAGCCGATVHESAETRAGQHDTGWASYQKMKSSL
ncbi:uncharacterized protein MAM_07167 [Metarhizium album ARSEF 1941]|uniref:Uncharacterized protein n=1 Tax=Metarhizium album (strain ARSEF 1941) TaxID=1081103 RepID=A0A0B2WPM3_METAS|nr:uncharacterized protein MAM_07167 [Metarhizium album ARSEF 1941]KHN94940.1 hypothetical protein MAM_07167 [Metarhizium album ARSEF 1941]